MSDDFNIQVKVQANIDPANKNFDKLTKAAAMGGKNISKSFDNVAKSVNKNSEDMAKKSKNATDVMKKGFKEVEGIAGKIFGPLGLSVGIGGLISQGHQLNQQVLGWHNSFRLLSDSTGDTSKAVSTMHQVWGKSTGSLSQIQSIMGTLSAKGLPVANKQFKDMAVWVTNMSNATGISAETFADFTIGLQQMYTVSLGTTAKMTSALVALGDGFGFTNNQIEEVIKSTSGALQKIGMFFDNVDKSMHSMTKGIGASTAAMKKMGVSVQTAGNFMSNILDPEKINENMGLFARLGISYGETMDMMSAENGQETFMDKLMTNIPALSRQITSLKNPMARLQFSKSLGLPLEIAQKMAKATSGEIQGLMADYKIKAEEDKANTKKQEKAKADADRFTDAMTLFKMKAMMPIMDFVQNNYGNFFKIIQGLSTMAKFLFTGLAKVLDLVVNVVIPPLAELMNGNFMAAFANVGKQIARSFETNPILTSLFGLATGFFAWSKLMAIKNQFGKAAATAFYKKTLAGSPITVKDISTIGAADTGMMHGPANKPSRMKTIGKGVGTGVLALGAGYAAGKLAENMGAGEGTSTMAAAGASMAAAAAGPMIMSGLSAAIGPVLGGIGTVFAGISAPVVGMVAAAGAVIGTGIMAVRGAVRTSEALQKKAGESTSLLEYAGGALGGAMSLFSTLSSDEMTRRLVGTAEQKAAATETQSKRDEANKMRGQISMGDAWQNAKAGAAYGAAAGLGGAPIGALGGALIGGVGSYVGGFATRGMVAATGAEDALGKGVFDEGQQAELKSDQETRAKVKAGKIKMNQWEIAALDAKIAYAESKKEAMFTSEDMDKKYEIKKKLTHLKDLAKLQTGAAKAETEAKIKALEDQHSQLVNKQEQNNIGFIDAISVGMAKIAKMIGFEEEMPYIAVRIRNTFAEMGMWISEAVGNILWDIKNPLTSNDLIEEADNLSKITTNIAPDGTRTADRKNLQAMEALWNRATAEGKTSEAERISEIAQGYKKELDAQDQRWKDAKQGIDIEKRKAEAEAAAALAESKKQTGLMGAGNKHLASIDNKTGATTGTSQSYINFYLKNQGFLGAVWTDGR